VLAEPDSLPGADAQMTLSYRQTGGIEQAT
jgi:hypothetical protein